MGLTQAREDRLREVSSLCWSKKERFPHCADKKREVSSFATATNPSLHICICTNCLTLLGIKNQVLELQFTFIEAFCTAVFSLWLLSKMTGILCFVHDKVGWNIMNKEILRLWLHDRHLSIDLNWFLSNPKKKTWIGGCDILNALIVH